LFEPEDAAADAHYGSYSTGMGMSLEPVQQMIYEAVTVLPEKWSALQLHETGGDTEHGILYHCVRNITTSVFVINSPSQCSWRICTLTMSVRLSMRMASRVYAGKRVRFS
jgi:hypothetical protein